MTFAGHGGRDGTEIEALITDRYLESLLVAHGSGADGAPAPTTLPPSLRDAADRLARSLPRVHPSFRFEEALSARIMSAALARRLPAAAGAEGRVITLPAERIDDDAALAAYLDPTGRRRRPGPGPAAADRRRFDLRRAVDRGRRLRRLASPTLARGIRSARRGQARSVGLMPLKLPTFRARRDAYPADLWTKCPSCATMLFNKQLDKAGRVCGTCGHHFRLSATARLEQLLDEATWAEHDAGLHSVDALGFVDQKSYPDRLTAAQNATGMRDAALWGTGAIGGHEIAVCVMDFGFMGGSMGAVVGEKVTRAAEHALAARIPLLVVSASGGARMQEGTLALMQLAKTLAAVERLRAAGVPFISLLSDPTTGGVFASFAAVGDVNVAEPNALIGFAGARVSAGTIATELPPGFQRAEFLFSHGFVDRVVARSALRDELTALLDLLPVRDATAPTVAPPADLPGFRPLSFLSTLADRVNELAGGEVPARAPGQWRRLERGARREDRRRLGPRPGRAQPAPAADARPGRGDDRRLRRTPW